MIPIRVKSWNLSYVPGKGHAPVATSTTHITEAGPRSPATKIVGLLSGMYKTLKNF